ncbi:MAG: hypothetical protein KJ964_00995 [Verrucomicrobia bacterium]|nr:hypothetical protein [Verrucomicrobiota bacterium]MBU1734315.1 hypothetical protein [Verrucomicrobiota bacterium]MBU1857036.1 hypothetical protein [Verrucomicrobiota bacterium]
MITKSDFKEIANLRLYCVGDSGTIYKFTVDDVWRVTGMFVARGAPFTIWFCPKSDNPVTVNHARESLSYG